MPDFHQPDEGDRRRAERTHAADGDVGDWAEKVPLEDLRRHASSVGVRGAASKSREELVEALRQRPSSKNDPSWPDRPLT